MEVKDLKKEIAEKFKSKTGAVAITENKKIQRMFDSVIETIAPYLEAPAEAEDIIEGEVIETIEVVAFHIRIFAWFSRGFSRLMSFIK